MKKFFTIIFILGLSLFLISCDSKSNEKVYDDSELISKINELENKIKELEETKEKLLHNIDSLEYYYDEIENYIRDLYLILESYNSERFIEYQRKHISQIQIFDFDKNKTLVYNIRSNEDVEKLIYDSWKNELSIYYVQGYVITLDYLLCKIYL